MVVGWARHRYPSNKYPLPSLVEGKVAVPQHIPLAGICIQLLEVVLFRSGLPANI